VRRNEKLIRENDAKIYEMEKDMFKKFKELHEMKKTEIFRYIDILISGRFVENLKTMQGGLIGSSNQQFIFFTKKYSMKDLSKINESEISIDENGKISIYGYETNDLQQWL
jgi:hypothetical protein